MVSFFLGLKRENGSHFDFRKDPKNVCSVTCWFAQNVYIKSERIGKRERFAQNSPRLDVPGPLLVLEILEMALAKHSNV